MTSRGLCYGEVSGSLLQMFVVNFNGKRNLDRWGGGDNSETGLREIGSDGVRWIEPVHDTVHCSSLVS
jgi:hypothetical protein